MPRTRAVQRERPGTPLRSPPSWVTSPTSNSPPHRGGHSSPQEQSFSVWPHAARPLLLPVWVGRTKPLHPSSPGRRDGKAVEAGEEMAGPVLAEATEEPRRGLSAKLQPQPAPSLWDRPTRRWTTERSLLQKLRKGFPSAGAPARAQRKGDTSTLRCSICGSRSLVHLILLKPFLAALGLQFQDSWGQVQVNGRGATGDFREHRRCSPCQIKRPPVSPCSRKPHWPKRQVCPEGLLGRPGECVIQLIP